MVWVCTSLAVLGELVALNVLGLGTDPTVYCLRLFSEGGLVRCAVVAEVYQAHQSHGHGQNPGQE
jgi:hypothetical protein